MPIWITYVLPSDAQLPSECHPALTYLPTITTRRQPYLSKTSMMCRGFRWLSVKISLRYAVLHAEETPKLTPIEHQAHGALGGSFHPTSPMVLFPQNFTKVSVTSRPEFALVILIVDRNTAKANEWIYQYSRRELDLNARKLGKRGS